MTTTLISDQKKVSKGRKVTNIFLMSQRREKKNARGTRAWKSGKQCHIINGRERERRKEEK